MDFKSGYMNCSCRHCPGVPMESTSYLPSTTRTPRSSKYNLRNKYGNNPNNAFSLKVWSESDISLKLGYTYVMLFCYCIVYTQ